MACNDFMPLRNYEKLWDVRYGLIRRTERSDEIVFAVPEVGGVS